MQKTNTETKDERSKEEKSYPSIVCEILISRRLRVDQKVGWWELIKALKEMIMIGRIWWREKLLRQGIQLCEHVNQLLDTEFRFSLRFWIHFVSISWNLSNRSHENQSHHPHKNPQQFCNAKVLKLVFLDRKQKRNTRNRWDSLLLHTLRKKKCRIFTNKNMINYFLKYYSRKLEMNKNPYNECWGIA